MAIFIGQSPTLMEGGPYVEKEKSLGIIMRNAVVLDLKNPSAVGEQPRVI